MITIPLMMSLALLSVLEPTHALNRPETAGNRRSRNVDANAEYIKRSPTFKYIPPAHAAYPKVASAWYAGWHGGPKDFPPEDLSYQKYTNIAYSFVVPGQDVTSTSVDAADDPILRKVVQYAHQVGTTVSICVGGWAGSQFWSGAVSTETKRQQLVTAIIAIVKKYGLDGVDFDWEYPNNSGVGCNEKSSKDSANFLDFIKDLRKSALPSSVKLSAATALRPFLGPDGNPLSDVSEFAEYLDYIEIMNYDVWGPWTSTAGPNAPLNDTCVSNKNYAQGSAVQGVASWTAAGFPLDQIILGVASYGHGFTVTPDNAFGHTTKDGKTTLGTTLKNSYPAFDAKHIPVGDAWDDGPGVDQCGAQQAQGGGFNFWGLVTNGFLDKKGNTNPGISYLYDTCSQTPTVYNATSHVWVEYDNAQSFTAKGQYIKNTGMRGFAMWEAGGDYNDILLDSIRTGAGFARPTSPAAVTTTRVYPTATPN